MNKSPAFQFYVNDWLSSPNVMLMTPEQEGAYIRLLCFDWANDGIPDDDDQLATLSRLCEGWFAGGSQAVRKCFAKHPTKLGFLTNPRLQKEREKQAEWLAKSRQGGVKSGKSRRGNSSWGTALANRRHHANQMRTKCEPSCEPFANSSSSSSSSSTKKKYIKKKKAENRLNHASAIYDVYPRKVGKANAIKSIEKILDEYPYEEILLKTQQFAEATANWPKEDRKFIPHPATWFNQGRFDDDPAEWTRNGQKDEPAPPIHEYYLK